MKMMLVTYTDKDKDLFEDVRELNRFNDILSFWYKPSTAVSWVDVRIRMQEVRKFEVWETNVD